MANIEHTVQHSDKGAGSGLIATDLTGQLQAQVQLHHKQFASFPDQVVRGVDEHTASVTAGADTYG